MNKTLCRCIIVYSTISAAVSIVLSFTIEVNWIRTLTILANILTIVFFSLRSMGQSAAATSKNAASLEMLLAGLAECPPERADDIIIMCVRRGTFDHNHLKIADLVLVQDGDNWGVVKNRRSWLGKQQTGLDYLEAFEVIASTAGIDMAAPIPEKKHEPK